MRKLGDNFSAVLSFYLICVVHAESDSASILKGVYKMSLWFPTICWSVDQLNFSRTRENYVSGSVLRGSVCVCVCVCVSVEGE